MENERIFRSIKNTVITNWVCCGLCLWSKKCNEQQSDITSHRWEIFPEVLMLNLLSVHVFYGAKIVHIRKNVLNLLTLRKKVSTCRQQLIKFFVLLFQRFPFLFCHFFRQNLPFFFLLLTSFVFRNYSFSYCYYCSDLFSLNLKKF